jgi:hypothetical protein
LAEDNTKTVFTWQYFYSPNGSYKNAVWISNNRLPNVWIYVLINELENKKARIWSTFPVNNLNQQLKSRYLRPSNFQTREIWVETPNRVREIDARELCDEITQRMQVICQMLV